MLFISLDIIRTDYLHCGWFVQEDEDASDDYGAKLGKLINLMGVHLIEVRQK